MWWLIGIDQASEIGMISNVTLNDGECKVACWWQLSIEEEGAIPMEVKWASSDWVASSEWWLGYELKQESLFGVLGGLKSGWFDMGRVCREWMDLFQWGGICRSGFRAQSLVVLGFVGMVVGSSHIGLLMTEIREPFWQRSHSCGLLDFRWSGCDLFLKAMWGGRHGWISIYIYYIIYVWFMGRSWLSC